jgi:predicted phosphodiesterase
VFGECPPAAAILRCIERDRPPSEGIRLAFVGDTTISSTRGLARRIAQDTPDAVIFCGDMVNEVDGPPRPRHLRRWRARWKPVAERTYAIPGNHDYGADGSLRLWWEVAAARLGGEATWYEERAFVLELPGVAVLGLDSGPSGRRVDAGQLEWMSARASELDGAAWRIIAVHGPLAPVSIHMSRPMHETSQEGVRRLAVLAGAQLVVSGHEHVYARTGPVEPPIRAQVVVGGGGAAAYPVLRSDLHASAAIPHHLLVTCSSERLTGRAVSDRGGLIDDWTWTAA